MMNSIDFVSLDIETATSFRGSICEIGLAFVKDSKIVGTKSWLIQPEDNEYDYFNIEIHGITPEMTKDAPTFEQVWPEVLPYLQNNTVVAHNTAFDMYALKDALDAAGFQMPIFDYFCSLRISRKAFPGLYSYSLPLLCEAIEIPFDTHHRAESDAKGCAEVFLKSLESLQIENLQDLPEKLFFRQGRFNGINHYPQRQKDAYKYKGNILKEIVADESKFDEDSYFFGKAVCFTGAFSFGVRKDLLQAIANIGGTPMNSVTKATNILVVGQQDYRVVGAEGMSSKQKKAMELIQKGQDLEIMSESEFLSNFGAEIPNQHQTALTHKSKSAPKDKTHTNEFKIDLKIDFEKIVKKVASELNISVEEVIDRLNKSNAKNDDFSPYQQKDDDFPF